MTVLVRCLGLAGYIISDQPQPRLVGQWLAAYDPEAHDGQGEAEWTGEPGEALRFASMAEAHRLWTTVPKSRPTRADGQPNRPLCAFTVEFVPEAEAMATGWACAHCQDDPPAGHTCPRCGRRSE